MRVALTTVLGIVAGLWLPGRLGLAPIWGVAGLTTAAALAAWVEFTLLVRGLRRRIGRTGVPWGFMAQIGAAAAAAAAAGRWVFVAMGPHGPWTTAIPVLGAYGVVYLGLAAAMRVPELAALGRLARRG